MDNERMKDFILLVAIIFIVSVLLNIAKIAEPKEEKIYKVVYVEETTAKKLPEIDFICRINPALTEQEAEYIYWMVADVIDEFRHDPVYNCGATLDVTVPIVLGVIATESKFDRCVKGSSGEIGLMQVLPKFHTKSLKKAGILKDSRELWDMRVNIKSGVYVLMHNAINSDTITEALAKYNAGNNINKGKSYARKVIRYSKQILS